MVTEDTGPFSRFEFKKSGVVIEPYNVHSRSERFRYEKLDVTVSNEAAEVISDNALQKEPVELYIDDNREGRYYYPKDAIEKHDETAKLTLYDALKISDYGSVSKRFESVTLLRVFEYVSNQIEDPHNVITDTQLTSPDIADLRTEEFLSEIGDNAIEVGGKSPGERLKIGGQTAKRRINESMANLARLVGFDDAHNGGFEFADDSPAQALAKIEQEFGFETWVDNDGVLWIGPREVGAVTSILLTKENVFTDYTLQSYNIVSPGNQVRKVVLKGETDILGSEVYNAVDINGAGPNPDKYRVVASATAPDKEGTVRAYPEPVSAIEPEAIENAAARKLAQIYADRNAGSMTFNGMASERADVLTELTVGSRIAVTDGVGEECNKDSDTGVFIVTAVDHSVDYTNGWEISVDVSAIPPEIETSSYIYNLSESKRYPSLDAVFKANNQDDDDGDSLDNLLGSP